MLSTNWDPVSVSAGKPNMTEPVIPIVAAMGIEREQLFDALALIQEVPSMNKGGQTMIGQARVRCQVLLNDGYLKEDTSKMCHLSVTIFADATMDGQEPELFQRLRKAAEEKNAMAFFGIQGRNRNQRLALASGLSNLPLNSFCNTTTRRKLLEEKAAELVAAQAEAVPHSVLLSRSIRRGQRELRRHRGDRGCVRALQIDNATDQSIRY